MKLSLTKTGKKPVSGLLVVCLCVLFASTSYAAEDKDIREIGDLRTRLQGNPDDYKAHFRLGVRYTEMELFDRAIDEFKEVIRIRPKLADAHVNLGVLYKGKGLIEEATHEFILATSINPNDAESHILLAGIYELRADKSFAIRELDEVARIDPKNIPVRFTLAELLIKEDRLKDAIERLKEIIKIAPDNIEAHYNLGVVYGKRALRGVADNDGFIKDGSAASMYIDYTQLAIEEFGKTVSLSPKHAQAHYNLGLAYVYAGKADKAHSEHAELANLDPELGHKLADKIKAMTSPEGKHVH